MWLEPVCAHLAEAGRRAVPGPPRQPLRARQGRSPANIWPGRARTSTGLPLIFLNRVGGQDELAFDGSSFIMHPDGELVVQMCDWDEDLLLTDWARTADGWRCETRCEHELDAFPGDVYRAMIVGASRLCRAQWFPRRDPRPVGRDRQRAVGGGRGRCARARQGVGRDAAIQIYQRGEPGGRARVRAAARLPP